MIEILTHQTKRDLVLELVTPQDVERVYGDIANALQGSFRSLPQSGNKITNSEVRDRFEIAFKIWVELRAEFEWTLDRCAAALPGCLLRALLNIDWEPKGGKRRSKSGRGAWTPNGYDNAAASIVPIIGGDARQVTHDLLLAGFPSRGMI